MAKNIPGVSTRTGETPYINSGIQIEKDEIVRSHLVTRINILEQQKDDYCKRMAESIENDSNIKDIRRRLEENNLVILKMMETNDILRNSAQLSITELEEKFLEENPQTYNEELTRLRDKTYIHSPWDTDMRWGSNIGILPGGMASTGTTVGGPGIFLAGGNTNQPLSTTLQSTRPLFPEPPSPEKLSIMNRMRAIFK